MIVTFNTFANVNPPWQLSQLDANFSAISTAFQAAQSTTLPYNVQNGNYVLQASDRGGVVVFQLSGTVTYTIPANTFGSGDWLLIKNISGGGGSVVIAPNIFGFSLFLAGGPPVSQGRTLSAIGLARLDFDSASQAVITGWGIT